MPTFSYIYPIPYLVFFCYLLCIFFLELKQKSLSINKKYLQWTTVISLILFFGLRGFIYTDWLVYHPFFEKVPTIWENGLSAPFNPNFNDDLVTDVQTGQIGMEIGFVYYTIILKSIFPDYHIYVLINTIIDITILHFFIRHYSKYYVLGFILFFVFEGIGIEANLIRNIKSILLFLISLKYLQERKFLPYMLINLGGFLVHSSAILYFPLYFFLHRNWGKWAYWSIFGIGILVVLFHISYIAPILTFLADKIGGRLSITVQLYLESDMYGKSYSLFRVGYLERIITFCLLMVFQQKLIRQNPINRIFINAFVIYFIIYFYFSEITVAVERLPMLFVFSYWILYPNLFSLLRFNLKHYVFIPIFTLFCIMKLINANSNILSKYDNLLFGIDSYEEREANFANHGDKIMGNE